MSFIGQNIKRIRTVRKLSQAKFAELFDLARPSVGAYEEGRAEPKINTVIDIAHHFGISIDVLLTKELTVNDLYSLNLVNQKLDDLHKGIVKEKSKDISTAKWVSQDRFVDYIVNHDKRDFINTLPECKLPIGTETKLRLFEMKGEYMVVDHQGLDHGDLLICEHYDNTKIEDLTESELILVVTKKQVKVGRLGEVAEKVTLIPDNPNFSDILIDPNNIIEIWKVRSNISMVVHPPRKLADKVSSVEDQLKVLLQRVENIEKGGEEPN